MKSQTKEKSCDGLKPSKMIVLKSRGRYFLGRIKKTQWLSPKILHQKRLRAKKVALKIDDSGDIKPPKSDAIVVSSNKHTLNIKNVEACVSAMLKFKSKNSKSESNLLFEDEAQPIHMMVQCIRVPVMKNMNYRFCLPNPLVDESSDVCLFVPNLKKGKSEDHEPTIEYYQDILEKHGVKGITQIIPMRQVNVEYDQFELRRRLVSQFDLFLADGRITGHIQGLLGKEIYKRRKLPVPVDMRVKDLKKEVETALSKTLLMMNGRGDKASLKVGHTKQSVQQISENIIAVAEGLGQQFPGGWANVRSLKIHLQDSAPVPVYLSLKSSNDVKVPVVTRTLPKRSIPVEGEVTTIPGVHVTVLPGGEVIIKKKKLTKEERKMGLTDSDLEDLESIEEVYLNNSDEETTPKKQEKVKKPLPKPEKKEDDDNDANNNTDSDVSSVDGDEHVVEAAENAYLNEWSEQWNKNVNENSRKRKEKISDEDVKKTKRPKTVKDKSKKKISKDSQSVKNKNKKKTKSANVTSPQNMPLKMLKVKAQKTAMKSELSKNTSKKQMFNKNLISQKKKNKFAA